MWPKSDRDQPAVATLVSMVLAAILVALACGCRHQSRGKPADHITEGWRWYRSGDFSIAIRSFESAIGDAGTDKGIRQRALYGLACTWSLRRPDEDPERARQYYNAAIAVDPSSDLAAWSLLALARMAAVPVAGEPAPLEPQRAAYQAVMDRFPSHPASEEAFLFLQAARLTEPSTNETADILSALDSFLVTHPDSPWKSTVYHLIEHCCEVLGLRERRLAAAIGEWESQAASAAQASQNLGLVYWRIATLAEFEAGDFDLARKYYRKLIAEYPTEQRVFLAKQELKRMDALEIELGVSSPQPADPSPAGGTSP